ncbi:response regulator [Allocoleopsis franciscana]|uniref:histidine kinase n=1 Tax=Allocoleopsis franciscana PCC 7113 TaxID=1173027 RepID=K9WGJ1_9CYAN|nr:response regulator [Allocoleopsis franciscana]AFZ18612.1 bacteriophytochrome (light-regulated signal transduction histidine kinase) [Allocoleopsis franciscana PCC 7113]
MNELSADPSSKYILIVDDQPNNLRLLSTTLMDAGYKVKSAISSQMALIGLQTALPELILLDIMMPDMNGYQLCQQLKANTPTKDIPVIFLSALDDEADKLKAFELGGVDYITKPFKTQEVLARVKNQLTLVRQQQRINEQNLQLLQQNLRLEQLNIELVQANTELLRSNKDLEEFAYIAAHDLRSPLQIIKAFTYLLSQKYQGVLDEKAELYITRIVEAGNRMERLIQDLLNYSRIGTKALEVEPLDCNQILQQVLTNLQTEIESSGAAITHEELPTVVGNATQLTQLFQNLICNAIKFRRPEVPPQVKISLEYKDCRAGIAREVENSGSTDMGGEQNPLMMPAERQTCQYNRVGEWVFGVHDNGIGIKPEDFERIFLVFQRLHTSEEYPGTGIGLAICKKIVERHGGHIWVESDPDLGTSFYFTLSITLLHDSETPRASEK